MLAIDASTRYFGLALYVGGRLYDVKSVSNTDTFSLDKLRDLYYTFEEICKEFEPEHVVIEKPAPVRNSKALTSINQVFGMIFALFVSKGVTVDTVHNRTAFKYFPEITGTGKEKKQNTVDYIKKLYPEFANEITDDHVADAVIIGEAYIKITENL